MIGKKLFFINNNYAVPIYYQLFEEKIQVSPHLFSSRQTDEFRI